MLNLRKRSAEPYAACPYCLTETSDVYVEPKNRLEKTGSETILPEEKLSQNKDIPVDCHYHFGFLSEREKREQIPDECVSCKDILECMLRKMR